MEYLDIEGFNASEYKVYLESLMKNNHGSSAVRVFFCIFFTVQCTIYSAIKVKNVPFQQVYEYLVIVLPLILAHTIWSEYIYLLNMVIFALLLWEVRVYYYLTYIKKIERNISYYHGRIQSISVLRGLTYLITVLCILAVDFRGFPRELAKTERYGYSLMDTGVGLFVLMSGIVHKDLNNWRNVIMGNMKLFTSLSAIGMGRYLTLRKLNYQQIVSEYGVHWNFFYTLAVCKFVSVIILFLSKKSNSAVNSIVQSFVLLMIHELILICGVQDWVFGDTPRTSLLSANKEGISSCLGYVAMYIFASHLKDELTNKRNAKNLHYKGIIIDIVLLKFTVGAVVLWILSFLSNYLRPASRTLANASYCIFIEAILITMISVLYFFENYFQNEKGNFEIPIIIDCANSNGLLYFLISNLLTGAVNLSLRTLIMSNKMTFMILNVYMILALNLAFYLVWD